MIMYNNNVQYPVVVDDSVQWRKCFNYLLKRGRLFYIIVPYFQINLTGDEFLQGIGVCLHLDQPDTEFRVKQFGCIV